MLRGPPVSSKKTPHGPQTPAEVRAESRPRASLPRPLRSLGVPPEPGKLRARTPQPPGVRGDPSARRRVRLWSGWGSRGARGRPGPGRASGLRAEGGGPARRLAVPGRGCEGERSSTALGHWPGVPSPAPGRTPGPHQSTAGTARPPRPREVGVWASRPSTPSPGRHSRAPVSTELGLPRAGNARDLRPPGEKQGPGRRGGPSEAGAAPPLPGRTEGTGPAPASPFPCSDRAPVPVEPPWLWSGVRGP